MFSHVSASRYEMFLSEFSVLSLIEMSGYIWPRSFIQTVNALCLMRKLFTKDSMVRHSHLVIFWFQGKVPCFARLGKLLARCLLSKAFRRPSQKNYISGYVWHSLFIQTIKCSLIKQITVNQSLINQFVKQITKLEANEILQNLRMSQTRVGTTCGRDR